MGLFDGVGSAGAGATADLAACFSLPVILVIDTGGLGSEGRLLLFVVPASGVDLDEALADRLRTALRTTLSPRHVPDEIHRIEEVPQTLNGKKMEVPIKQILAGTPVEHAVRLDAMANPGSIDAFVRFADRDPDSSSWAR